MSAPTVQRHEPVEIVPPDATLEQKLAVRDKGIGGSDVAGLLGLDKWKSPYSVWADKVHGLSVDETERMRWGQILEAPIAAEWGRRQAKEVRPAGVYAHPEFPWQRISPDRLVNGQRAYLEVKTVDRFAADDYEDDGETMPDQVRLQVQWGLHVLGHDVGYVAALVGGNTPLFYTVERDQSLIDMVVERATAFWTEHVLAKAAPPVDGHAATTDVLGRLYDVDPDSVLPLDDRAAQVMNLLAQLGEAKALVKASETSEDAITNQLRELLGEKEIATIAGRKAFTNKQQTRKSYVVQESTFRVLRVAKEYTS